jgi:ribonuclease Z
MGRKTLLNLYAPAPAEELITRHLADFDINLGFDLAVHTVSGRSLKQVLDDKRVEVFSFPLKHRIPTYGYLFREKMPDRNMIKEKITEYGLSIEEIATARRGGDIIRENGEIIPCTEVTMEPRRPASYAFCSDTGWFKKLPSYVKGVDLLYHEATFGADNDALAVKTLHSTASHAARVALEAGAGRLLLGHFSSRYRSTTMLEDEARNIFPATEAAREGNTYEIG